MLTKRHGGPFARPKAVQTYIKDKQTRSAPHATRSFLSQLFPVALPITMSTALGRTEVYSLLSLSLACLGVLANTFQGDGEPLIASIAFSGIAFSACYSLIRWLGNAFIRRGFKGRDLCKVKQTEMYADVKFPNQF